MSIKSKHSAGNLAKAWPNEPFPPARDEKEFLQQKSLLLKKAMRGTTRDLLQQISESVPLAPTVQEHPLASVGLSFAGGFLASFWIKKSPDASKAAQAAQPRTTAEVWPMIVSSLVDVGKVWLQNFLLSPSAPREESPAPDPESAPSDTPSNPAE